MDQQESIEEQVQKMFEDIRRSPLNGDVKGDFFNPAHFNGDDIALYWKARELAVNYNQKAIRRTLSSHEMEHIKEDVQVILDYHKNEKERKSARFPFAQHLLNSIDATVRGMLDAGYTF